MDLISFVTSAFMLLVVGFLAYLGYWIFATRRIAANAERMVPPSGSFVEIDGNRIHYVDAGEGPTILFIHGLGGQLHHFRHTLFSRLPGYRLVAIDRPGSGYSTRVRGGEATLTRQAEIVAAVIERLGLGTPLLVGHSLGGAVALMTALNHRVEVAGLALLAPLTHHREDVPAAFQALAIRSDLKRWALSHTFSVPLSLKHASQALNFVFGPQPVPPDYIVAGGGWAGLRPSHIYATGTDFVALEHELPVMETRYGELDVPVGILFGTADQVLEYDRHGLRMRDKIRDLDLELIEGLGHMPQFVEPERTAAFIMRIAAQAFRTA